MVENAHHSNPKDSIGKAARDEKFPVNVTAVMRYTVDISDSAVDADLGFAFDFVGGTGSARIFYHPLDLIQNDSHSESSAHRDVQAGFPGDRFNQAGGRNLSRAGAMHGSRLIAQNDSGARGSASHASTATRRSGTPHNTSSDQHPGKYPAISTRSASPQGTDAAPKISRSDGEQAGTPGDSPQSSAPVVGTDNRQDPTSGTNPSSPSPAIISANGSDTNQGDGDRTIAATGNTPPGSSNKPTNVDEPTAATEESNTSPQRDDLRQKSKGDSERTQHSSSESQETGVNESTAFSNGFTPSTEIYKFDVTDAGHIAHTNALENLLEQVFAETIQNTNFELSPGDVQVTATLKK